MSYCVKDNDSNIHLFQISNLIFCHQCLLTERQTSVAFDQRGKVIDHLMKHSMKSHKLREGVIATLLDESQQVGEQVTGQEDWKHERSTQYDHTTTGIA